MNEHAPRRSRSIVDLFWERQQRRKKKCAAAGIDGERFLYVDPVDEVVESMADLWDDLPSVRHATDTEEQNTGPQLAPDEGINKVDGPSGDQQGHRGQVLAEQGGPERRLEDTEDQELSPFDAESMSIQRKVEALRQVLSFSGPEVVNEKEVPRPPSQQEAQAAEMIGISADDWDRPPQEAPDFE